MEKHLTCFVIRTRTFRTRSVAVKFRFHQPNSPSFNIVSNSHRRIRQEYRNISTSRLSRYPRSSNKSQKCSIHFHPLPSISNWTHHIHPLPSSRLEFVHWQDDLYDSTKVGFSAPLKYHRGPGSGSTGQRGCAACRSTCDSWWFLNSWECCWICWIIWICFGDLRQDCGRLKFEYA